MMSFVCPHEGAKELLDRYSFRPEVRMNLTEEDIVVVLDFITRVEIAKDAFYVLECCVRNVGIVVARVVRARGIQGGWPAGWGGLKASISTRQLFELSELREVREKVFSHLWWLRTIGLE